MNHLAIAIVLSIGLSCHAQVQCNMFKVHAALNGHTLTVSLETDLPDEAELMMSVDRSRWDVGESEEYSLPYFSERTTVRDWRRPRELDVRDEIWHRALSKNQTMLASAGMPYTVREIDDHIEIDFVLPINQTDPRFGKGNKDLTGTQVESTGIRVIQSETRIYLPLGITAANVNTPTPVNPDNLEVGSRYRIDRLTRPGEPTKPFRLPCTTWLNSTDSRGDPSEVAHLNPGVVITVLERNDREQDPFGLYYRVRLENTSRSRGTNFVGWIYSPALYQKEIWQLDDEPSPSTGAATAPPAFTSEPQSTPKPPISSAGESEDSPPPLPTLIPVESDAELETGKHYQSQKEIPVYDKVFSSTASRSVPSNYRFKTIIGTSREGVRWLQIQFPSETNSTINSGWINSKDLESVDMLEVQLAEVPRQAKKKTDVKKSIPIKYTKLRDEYIPPQSKRLATFEMNQRLNVAQLQQVCDELVRSYDATVEQTFLSFTLPGTQYSYENGWASAHYHRGRLDSIEIHGLSAEQANMLIDRPKPKGQVIGQWFWGRMKCLVSIVRKGKSYEMMFTPGFGETAGQHRIWQELDRSSSGATMTFTRSNPTELEEQYVCNASGNLEFHDVDGKHLELEPILSIPNWQPPAKP